jgi:phospholipid-binding lipoprotein MlaA
MPNRTGPRLRLRALLLCAILPLALLGGCASNGDPRDPFEPVNRFVYKFNDGVDTIFVRPAAEIYRGVLPPIVRTGISNFFSNINDVIVALNNLLQGKINKAGSDVARIIVNTTVGVLGFVDVATKIGLEKNNEDFGQTLGYWGFGDGPYIVLPFLGPSSARDTVGWVGDYFAWPISYVDPNRDRNALIALRFVDARADLLEASQILETAALDPYTFMRDGYLQRRRNQVYDGNPPDTLDNGNNNRSKRSSRAPAKSAQPAADDDFPAGGTVLISGDWQPTPAEIEALGRARSAEAAPPASRPAAAAEPQKTGRNLRVWLPFGRD